MYAASCTDAAMAIKYWKTRERNWRERTLFLHEKPKHLDVLTLFTVNFSGLAERLVTPQHLNKYTEHSVKLMFCRIIHKMAT